MRRPKRSSDSTSRSTLITSMPTPRTGMLVSRAQASRKLGLGNLGRAADGIKPIRFRGVPSIAVAGVSGRPPNHDGHDRKARCYHRRGAGDRHIRETAMKRFARQWMAPVRRSWVFLGAGTALIALSGWHQVSRAGSLSVFASCGDGNSISYSWTFYEYPSSPTGHPEWV